MSAIDEKLDEAGRAVVRALAQIDLPSDEKQFVETAGRQLHEYAFNQLAGHPGSERLRPMVIAFALACLLGPWNVAANGLDACKE